MDKTAAVANFELLIIRHYGSHPHRAPAQSTKADVLRELMLNTMVGMHRGIIINHGIHRIGSLQRSG